MLAAVLRDTGDKEVNWTTKHKPSKERYDKAIQMMQGGDMTGLLIAMVTRVFYSDLCGDLTYKLDNENLGLPNEDLEVATEEAVDTATRG